MAVLLGDPARMGATFEQFLGTGAGLSASSITRLTTQWQDEAHAFALKKALR